ncbi:MAG TPA: VOC family protein [Mycobacteriales bacterium]|nr:VOC family protein [Mycobacteriales bacterium]
MSHRSRLCAALVDVRAETYDATVHFWGAALDRTGEVSEQDPDYTVFGEVAPGVTFMVQRVDAPDRVHLDIETDDVEAEVARLVALGATEVERIHSWVVMRDPVGILFCVVRIQSPEAFEASATTWA